MNKYIRIGLLFSILVSVSFFIADAISVYMEKDTFIISQSNPIQYPFLSDNDLYQYYSNLSRPQTLNYMIYITDPIDDNYIQEYTVNITSGKSFDTKYDEINFILNYVRSIPYVPDSIDTEYPQYPIETLTLWHGDCEDKSILCASMLYSLGYDVCLFMFETHMAVGVKIDNFTSYMNNYVYIDPTIYVSFGEIFPRYSNQNVTQYTLESPIILHQWISSNCSWTIFKKMLNLNIKIDNIGVTNTNITLSIHAYNENYSFYNNKSFTISAQSSINVIMSNNIDAFFHGIIETSIISNGEIIDKRSGVV